MLLNSVLKRIYTSILNVTLFKKYTIAENEHMTNAIHIKIHIISIGKRSFRTILRMSEDYCPINQVLIFMVIVFYINIKSDGM